MNDRAGVALVLCAPSGTGKTTLAHRLVSEFPRFTFSVSVTTRPPRPDEVDGKDYHFMTTDEFHSLREQRYFAEWASVHGNFYGTPLHATRDLLAQGRDILFDIDVQGAAQLKLTLPQASFMFLLPPSRSALESRLRGRGSETEESIALRMTAARRELAQANWFDLWIINDDLDAAYADLVAAYRSACLAPVRRPEFVNSLLREWP